MIRSTNWPFLTPAQPGPPPYAAPGWALIALFIIYGSVGPFTGGGPSAWGPLYVSLPDVLQNILLYFPFGCFGVLALDNRRHSFVWRTAEIAAFACGFSLIAETAQLFIINRTASITDVVAGTVGAALGALWSPAIARLANVLTARARVLGLAGSPIRMALFATLTALAAVAWWPFDITLDPGTVSARVNAFRADPWQSGDWIGLGSQALRYVLATLLIATSLEGVRPRDAAFAATLSGLVLAIVLDAGQMVMGGRPAGVADLEFQTAGCLVGGALLVMARKADRHPPA